MEDDIYARFLLTAKKLGKILDEKLRVQRTALVMEGMGVNHVHIKLYPLHGLGKDFKPMIPEGETYFEKYPGYLTTLLGPKGKEEDLLEVKKQIAGE